MIVNRHDQLLADSAVELFIKECTSTNLSKEGDLRPYSGSQRNHFGLGRDGEEGEK